MKKPTQHGEKEPTLAELQSQINSLRVDVDALKLLGGTQEKGEQGEPGEKGEQGEQGEAGERGEPGKKGGGFFS
jgi:hypothetical protein